MRTSALPRVIGEPAGAFTDSSVTAIWQHRRPILADMVARVDEFEPDDQPAFQKADL